MKFLIGTAVLALFAIACSGSSEESTPTPVATEPAVPRATVVSTTSAAAQEPSPTPQSTNTAEPSPSPQPTATTPPAPQPTAPPVPTSPPASNSPPPASGGVVAQIKGYGFPYQLTVPAGSTVVWTNLDTVPHDVTAKDDSWASGLLGQGQSYSRTFSAPGKYAYVCRVHPYMTAVLIVE